MEKKETPGCVNNFPKVIKTYIFNMPKVCIVKKYFKEGI